MASALHSAVMSPEVMTPLMEHHVGHECIVKLAPNRLLSVIRLKGISHETTDQVELDRQYERLNRYFLALGKKEGANLMLQAFITKAGLQLDTQFNMPLSPLQDFVAAYTKPFRNGTYRQVGYTLVLILRYPHSFGKLKGLGLWLQLDQQLYQETLLYLRRELEAIPTKARLSQTELEQAEAALNQVSTLAIIESELHDQDELLADFRKPSNLQLTIQIVSNHKVRAETVKAVHHLMDELIRELV